MSLALEVAGGGAPAASGLAGLGGQALDLEGLPGVGGVEVRAQLADVAHDGVLAVEALEVRDRPAGRRPVARRSQQVHDLVWLMRVSVVSLI